MKAKQKNIRIFEIEIQDEESFFNYMEKNIILLKEYLLLINGTLTPKMRTYLEEEGTCYKETATCNLKLSSKSNGSAPRDVIEKPDKESQQEVVKYVEVEKEHDEKTNKTLLFDKPIRSGEEVIYDGDITIFGRVNSAAKVICQGNVEVYGRIDGLVQCDGRYMIVKDIDKGYVVFNGDILEKELFDGNLKKITRSEEGAVIKDVF